MSHNALDCFDDLVSTLRDDEHQQLYCPYPFADVPDISYLPHSALKQIEKFPSLHQFFLDRAQAQLHGSDPSTIAVPDLDLLRVTAEEHLLRTMEGCTRALARGVIGMLERTDTPVTPFTATNDQGFDTALDLENLKDSQRTKDDHTKIVRDTLWEWRSHLREYIELLDVFRWIEEKFGDGADDNNEVSPLRPMYARRLSWDEQMEMYDNGSDSGTYESSEFYSTPALSPCMDNLRSLPTDVDEPFPANVERDMVDQSLDGATAAPRGTSRYKEITEAIELAIDFLCKTCERIEKERQARVIQVRGGNSFVGSCGGDGHEFGGDYVIVQGVEEEE